MDIRLAQKMARKVIAVPKIPGSINTANFFAAGLVNCQVFTQYPLYTTESDTRIVIRLTTSSCKRQKNTILVPVNTKLYYFIK